MIYTVAFCLLTHKTITQFLSSNQNSKRVVSSLNVIVIVKSNIKYKFIIIL